MSTSKSAARPAKNKVTKKHLLAELAAKLETALGELKSELGDKKFSRRLKKAAKVLLHGLDKKQEKPKKKATPAKKIASAKKAAPAKKSPAKAAAPAGKSKKAVASKVAPSKTSK